MWGGGHVAYPFNVLLHLWGAFVRVSTMPDCTRGKLKCWNMHAAVGCTTKASLFAYALKGNRVFESNQTAWPHSDVCQLLFMLVGMSCSERCNCLCIDNDIYCTGIHPSTGCIHVFVCDTRACTTISNSSLILKASVASAFVWPWTP